MLRVGDSVPESARRPSALSAQLVTTPLKPFRMRTLRLLAASHTCSFARPRTPQSRLETTRTRRPSALSVQPATSVRLEDFQIRILRPLSVFHSCSVWSLEPKERASFPSALSAHAVTLPVWPAKKQTVSPLAVFQSRSVRSLEAERASRPSALSAHAVTSSVCPSTLCTVLPLTVFHTRSSFPELERASFPSALSAHPVTSLSWACKIVISLLVVFQSRSVLSREEERASFPSALSAQWVTSSI